MDMRVPILRPALTREDAHALQRDFADLLASGYLVLGPHTERFEDLFATFSGTRFAVACSSCTAALELILRGLGIEGRSVVVPTNTFAATAFAALHAGNRVVFADSDPKTFSLTVADVERRLADDTAAVITVHIGGVVSPEIDELRQLCRRRGLQLIEDCAHAHGSSLEGRPAGSLSVAGAFSFFPTKVLTTGEGGMVTTDDEELAARIRSLRNHGKDPELQNRMSSPGHNYRMSEVTAMLGVRQMECADNIVVARQKLAAFYDQALAGVAGVRPLPLAGGVSSTYYKYILLLDEGVDRSRLKQQMRDDYGVAMTGEVYADLCHTEPVWQRHTHCGAPLSDPGQRCPRWSDCGCAAAAAEEFPGAEWIRRNHACLPLYPRLTTAEAEYVVGSLVSALRDH